MGDRRFSQSIHDDVGIATIQQLLEQGGSTEQPRDKRPSGQTGVATFSGKVDRSASSQKRNPGSPGASEGASPGVAQSHNGFFSMPSMTDKEASGSPFFGGDESKRRQSIASGHISRSSSRKEQKQPDRPEPVERSSDKTATPDDDRSKVENPSANASGSGLPDPDRPPVGQPSRQPETVNFVHRPGGDSLEASTSFKSVGTTDKVTSSKTGKPFNAKSDKSDQGNVERTPTSTGIKQPKPRSVGRGPMPGLGGSDTSSRRGSPTNLSVNGDGEQTLVQDFANIVRLDEAGSGSGTATGAGTGTGSGGGSKSRASVSGSGQSGGVMGGSLRPLAANQQRNARDTTRDSVRDFVQSQAHQTNLSDPNAHTTSTPNNAESPEEPPNLADTPPPRAPLEESPASDPRSWAESSDASMSVQDSSEQATASVEETAESEDDEPIVTFRFEHSQNEDGHHVVVGREGKLRSCEDEPITTPGAVQGFGVLMVLEEDYDTGDLVVRQVSEVSLSVDKGSVIYTR